MNLSLEDNMTKLVLLVVVGVVCLLVINMKQKQLGKNVSVLLSVAVIGVCGYFGYVVLNQPEPVQENNMLNELQPPVFENFQNNVVQEQVEDEEEDAEEEAEEEATNETNNEVSEEAANENNANNQFTSSALLPTGNSLYSQTNPSGNGDVTTSSLLNAGHHIGVNTTGCSMRNANRGLRSECPNPQVQVSPWLQTTICPDLFRKPLDPNICE